MTGMFLYPQPETAVAFACVTAALIALQRRTGHGGERPLRGRFSPLRRSC